MPPRVTSDGEAEVAPLVPTGVGVLGIGSSSVGDGHGPEQTVQGVFGQHSYTQSLNFGWSCVELGVGLDHLVDPFHFAMFYCFMSTDTFQQLLCFVFSKKPISCSLKRITARE